MGNVRWISGRIAPDSISGQTSGELFITMYPSIFQSHADLAHLMIGTNDCRRTVDAPHALHTGLEEFEKNFPHKEKRKTEK